MFKIKGLEKIEPPKVKKQVVTKKEFAYSFGECSLNFTLTVEEKQLSDFKKCLSEAITDIDEALNNLK